PELRFVGVGCAEVRKAPWERLAGPGTAVVSSLAAGLPRPAPAPARPRSPARAPRRCRAAGGAPPVPFRGIVGSRCGPASPERGGRDGGGGPGWAGSQPAAAPWYASLYFCCAIEDQDNELLTLEVVHRYVELLDRYFGNVCELDIIFNFEKAYFILDEFIIGGEVQETSKKTAVKAIEDSDMLQETVEEYMNKPAF
uniref:Adaptor related protein complex 1 subunit sigma 3 n=1 Tax=Taeniopygia guttata TaxID=59729 RepID=A0A674HSH0_TAEGU